MSVLEENGWIIECESPFEIRHEDGSFATGKAANIIESSYETGKVEQYCKLFAMALYHFLKEKEGIVLEDEETKDWFIAFKRDGSIRLQSVDDFESGTLTDIPKEHGRKIWMHKTKEDAIEAITEQNENRTLH